MKIHNLFRQFHRDLDTTSAKIYCNYLRFLIDSNVIRGSAQVTELVDLLTNKVFNDLPLGFNTYIVCNYGEPTGETGENVCEASENVREASQCEQEQEIYDAVINPTAEWYHIKMSTLYARILGNGDPTYRNIIGRLVKYNFEVYINNSLRDIIIYCTDDGDVVKDVLNMMSDNAYDQYDFSKWSEFSFITRGELLEFLAQPEEERQKKLDEDTIPANKDLYLAILQIHKIDVAFINTYPTMITQYIKKMVTIGDTLRERYEGKSLKPLQLLGMDMDEFIEKVKKVPTTKPYIKYAPKRYFELQKEAQFMQSIMDVHSTMMRLGNTIMEKRQL